MHLASSAENKSPNTLTRIEKAGPGGVLKKLVVLLVISLSAGVAEAIVLHPDAEPDMQSWTDRPHIDVLARWGINASCVVIAPNYIITVQHQGGGTHTPVVVAGNTYSIAEIWNHSDADLRIARLDNADLQQYVGLCGLRDEPGRDIAMAGFGDGREYELKTDDIGDSRSA